MKYLAMAVKAEPNHIQALYLIGSICNEAKDFQNAKRAYDKIISCD